MAAQLLGGCLMAVVVQTGAGNVTSAVASSATAITVSKPSNTADGDLLLALVVSRNGDSGYSSVPSGWTLVPGQPSIPAGSGSMRWYSKPIPSAAAETATDYTWSGATVSGRVAAIIVRVTGWHPSTPVDALSATVGTVVGANTTSATLTGPAATATVPNTLVLSGMYANTTSGQTYMTVPAGTTLAAQAVTNTGAANSQLQIATNTQSGSGSTGSKQWTTSVSTVGSGVAFTLVLRPTAAVPTVTPPGLQYVPTNTNVSMSFDTHSDASTVEELAVTQVSNGAPTITLGGDGLSPRVFTPTLPGLYRFEAVATDADGQDSAAATATVAVYSPTGDAMAQSLISNPDGWTNVGGDDIVEAVVDPGTDAIQSPSAPTNDAITYQMQPLRPGNVTVKITHRFQPIGGAATTCKVDVLQGDSLTQVATETFNLTDSWVDDTLPLDSGENTAFTNHAVWALRLTANQ